MQSNTISGHRPSICEIVFAYVGLIDKDALPLYVGPISIDHDVHSWNVHHSSLNEEHP